MRPISQVKVTARRTRTYWERGAMVPQRMAPVARAPRNIGTSMAMTMAIVSSTVDTWSGENRRIRVIGSTK